VEILYLRGVSKAYRGKVMVSGGAAARGGGCNGREGGSDAGGEGVAVDSVGIWIGGRGNGILRLMLMFMDARVSFGD
jgi:hypothetical protein